MRWSWADLLAPVIHSGDPLDPAATGREMVRAVRNAPRVGTVSYAISAVDVALWDLAARLSDLPLVRLLGRVHDSVPVYGSGGFTTYDDDQLREQLTGWAEDEDIPRVKIKIGESWGSRPDRDLARMRQARETIGPDVDLFVDANGAYSAKQAVRVMAAAAELGVVWFEEPVSSDDLAGLALVRSRVDADVTAGEYGTDLFYFRRMCEAGAVDCLQVDASRCGGATAWARAAAVAAAFNLDVSGHCAPHLHAHLAAATPNLRHLEWFADHVRIERELFEGTLDPSGGVIVPDLQRAGHGLALRERAASEHLLEQRTA